MKFEFLKTKIWFSREQKEWNKKHFSKFHKCSLLDLKKETSKNVAGTTFKARYCILLLKSSYRKTFCVVIWLLSVHKGKELL